MSIWKACLLAVMIPTALMAPALAQEAGAPDTPRWVFEELDADGNGAVTLEEMRAAAPNRFAEADRDGNGALSRAELLAQGQARAEARIDRLLERADTDGDGEVSLAEMQEAREGRGRRGPAPERVFNRLDADGDGTLTEAEFDDGVSRLIERMGRRHGQGRDRG